MATTFDTKRRKILGSVAALESHPNGPRVFLFGRRVHEFQVGFSSFCSGLATGAVPGGPHWLAAGVQAGFGVWLVVKDWPDLFPSTRDTACWRFGIHRPPVAPWQAKKHGAGSSEEARAA